MAEYRDFFKLAHDDSYDKQPLVKLRDNDRIPDLRKYTMGDLRSWVAENSPGLPSVLPKGVIRASSQLADGVVTSSKILDGTIATSDLTDKAITPDKIDWAQMPAVTLASWQCSDMDTAPRQGWAITTSASLVTLGYTNNIIDPPSLLPPRTGYSRQYRMVAALAHFAAVGETAFRFIVEENYSALGVNHLDSTNLIDRPLIALGAWASNAYLDSVAPDPVRIFLRARAEWAGATGNGTVRAVTIQGRYV